MVRQRQPRQVPKLQLSPTHIEQTVGPAGSNAATTAQDAASPAGKAKSSKLSGRVELVAGASTTMHNSAVSLNSRVS